MSAVASPTAAHPSPERDQAGHDQPSPRQTALHDVHRGLGAVLTEFAGWTMPLRYGSETAEHHAVRQAAALFDLSHMGEIEVTGPGAAAMLDHALVGRLSAVGVGRARYTMLCAPDGGVLDDLIVYRLEEQRYLVVANAANTSVVSAALGERATGFQALVRDVSADWALLAVQGPRSADILRAVTTTADVDALRYYAIDPAVLAGTPVLLARTGYTGEDGFEVYCAPGDAAAVWAALTAAGAGHGLVPAGLACRDTLRLEAGMPLYGHELTAGRTPFEAGLGRVVVLDKPFVGRDALVARAEAGPAELLVGLLPAGRRAPRAGYDVLDPDTGVRIGTVTSGAPSPTLGRPIGMAYVPADRAAVGTVLAVDIRGSRDTVTVVDLPFYRRPAGGHA